MNGFTVFKTDMTLVYLRLYPLLRVMSNGTLRMASSGMLRCVALVKTDGSEELSAFFIRVTRIGELGASYS
jgi:hypothetical protein